MPMLMTRIRYYFNSPNSKCTGYPTEDSTNNYIGIRHFGPSDPVKPSPFGDTSYAIYQTGNQGAQPYGINFTHVDFVEYRLHVMSMVIRSLD